ncbi:MAG: type II secretion system GspH family protein [Kiritimatiellales bacterium]|nr:type II secretion system GspH family protein [Kiritimatiellales bacterium]
MKRNKKAGFTLVELMVVAIIVAILAAVAIPLMSGNKERAVATEGQAGCSTIQTAQRVYKAEHGTYHPSATSPSDLPGFNAGDLDGTYFNDASYVITPGAASYSVAAATIATNGVTGTLTMTVASDGSISWSGLGQ